MVNVHLLFISRLPKQVDHSFSRPLLVSLIQMKEQRSENVHHQDEWIQIYSYENKRLA